MRGVVCAVGIGRKEGTRELVVDPSNEEFVSLDGGGTFAFLLAYEPSDLGRPPNVSHSPSETLVWSNWTAYPFDEGELVRAQDVARVAVRELWRCMKDDVGVPEGRLVQRHADVKVESIEVEIDDDEMEI